MALQIVRSGLSLSFSLCVCLITGHVGDAAAEKLATTKLKDIQVYGTYVRPLDRDFHLDAHAAFGFTWGFSGNTGEQEDVRDANDGDKEDPCAKSDGSGLGGSDPGAGSNPKRGNPVVVGTGNKVETEVDFASAGDMPLTLERTYNYYWDYRGLFGKFWVSSFDYSLVWTSGDSQIYAQRPDGRRIQFNQVSGTRWNEDKATPVAYIEKNADGTWTHHNESLGVEVYNTAGRPLSIKSIAGIGWTYHYGTGDLANYPIDVTHTSGRMVQFGWTISAAAGGVTGGYLTTVTAPDNSTFTYTYDLNKFGTGIHRLNSATAPTMAGNVSTQISYLYEKAAMPGALTGKSFQGQRYSTFDYDTNGRSTLTQHHAGAAIVDKYMFSYSGTVTPPSNPPGQPPGPGVPCVPSGQGHCYIPRPAPQDEVSREAAENAAIAAAEDASITTVLANTTVTETNPLGRTTTYTFNPKGRVTNMSEAASANCSARAASRVYNGNGYPGSITDYSNNQTISTYNPAGQLTAMTEGYLSPVSRASTYTWDPVYNQMTSETVAGDHSTTYGYNADRRLTSLVVTNLSSNGTPNQTRTWGFLYAKYATGIVQTMIVNGPLAQDNIAYGYSAAGDLTSVTNQLGQATTYSNHNGLGLPGRVVGQNGDVTDYAYYPGGRLKSVTTYPNGTTASTTTLTYSAGLLATSTAPDGTATTYTYDTARRLTNLSRPEINGTAERKYFYDAASNVIREEIYRGATLRYRVYTDYDELGRVIARRGNNSENVRYTYDANSNVKTITDSLGRVTTLAYDALNRVATSKDPKNGLTQFQYDKGDRITSITDPRSLATTYTFDGFGQLWKEISPDRGTTSFVWDANGQRTSMTRANFAATTYGYDGLGRLTSIAAGGVSEVYGYDWCINGKGRVCNADVAGGGTPSTTQYQYELDGRVRVRREVGTVAGVQTDFWTSYGYDAYGRLTSLTYPNGEVAGYSYASGQPSGMTIKIGGVTSNVVSGLGYEPMGPATGWTYGNGLTLARGFDLDRRLASQSTKNGATALQGLAYGYNANDLITGITNAVDAAQSHSYGYDELSRLNSYAYDANGNRISGNTIATNSNRLTGTNVIVTGSTFSYDAPGNIINYALPGIGNVGYGYDTFNRMSSVDVNGAVAGSYGYNAYGERTSKTVSGVRTRFVYTNAHSLIAEKPDTGNWTNYLWFGGELVGMTRAGQRYAIHNDHLGRPELATNTSKGVVWKSNNGTFGGQTLVTNAIGDLNVGFPGQYFDAESGLWYNLNRYYDANTGRYWQVDPIGLRSGVNPYTYAKNNSVMSSDASGLDVCLEPVDNPNVPLGFHQRVAVYNSSGQRVYGQAFGSTNPNATLSTSESSGDAKNYSGGVYEDDEDDVFYAPVACESTSDSENDDVVQPLLADDARDSSPFNSAPYSATSIGGYSCRDYAQVTYARILSSLDTARRSGGGGGW